MPGEWGTDMLRKIADFARESHQWLIYHWGRESWGANSSLDPAALEWDYVFGQPRDVPTPGDPEHPHQE